MTVVLQYGVYICVGGQWRGKEGGEYTTTYKRKEDMSGNVSATNENDTTALIICIFIMTIYVVHDERNR